MNIFVILALALLIIMVLLRRHVPIGPAILAAGFFIWATTAPQFHYLPDALYTTLTSARTYDLILALYFVMCLEIELRTGGVLDGMVRALHHLLRSPKLTLAIMPAFLGLLPSLGGARFSAPIVEGAAKNLGLTAEHKANINFWFRHIFEFSSPIIPGMLMACSIANIPFSQLLRHLAWVTPLFFAIGWFVLMRPLKLPAESKDGGGFAEHKQDYIHLLLALAPVAVNFVNFILIVSFNFSAAAAMALVAVTLIFVLRFSNHVINIKQVFTGACDLKMLMNILCIFYFIQILTDTKVLYAIVSEFQKSPLPQPVIVAAVSFIIGVLTGMSQGHVAIVMPIIAAMAPGDLTLAGIAMVFGVAGQMLTPTHMCLIVTLNYFKADYFKCLRTLCVMSALLLAAFSAVTYVMQ